ncbi:MAG: FAD-dependent oxidoreductase [Actinomycetota bacterium]|nr:FAD-dependent oxidoreductase [Actinomycetota bacterium]
MESGGVVRVLGANWCPDCKRAKQFLSELRVPYEFIDVEQNLDAREEVLAKNNGKLIIPVIEFVDGSILVEPSNSEIANVLGLEISASKSFYDVIIVGGGPAGLTSAIYSAREGLDVLVVDRGALGGQAGSTERVDNYPGFPDGITGAELASRYVTHAQRYQVELVSGVSIESIRRDGHHVEIITDQGKAYQAHSVVLATGSKYRRLEVKGEDDLIGAGIHFCATCDGPFYKGAKNLIVVGGGNSAVEEGLFLSQFADHITILQNAPTLTASKLLQDRVNADPKFTVHTNTAVNGFVSNEQGRFKAVEVSIDGESSQIEGEGAFIFIGLTPNTSFLEGLVELTDRGFIQTSQTFETSIEGVFAAGDVRNGSTKQIASAVGEGAAVSIMVRGYLERLKEIAPHH